MDHELDTLQRLAGLEVEVKHIKETTDKIDNKLDEKTDKIADKLDALIASFPTRQELTAELKSRDEAIAAVWEDLQDFKRKQEEESKNKKYLLPTWISILVSIIALFYSFMK